MFSVGRAHGPEYVIVAVGAFAPVPPATPEVTCVNEPVCANTVSDEISIALIVTVPAGTECSAYLGLFNTRS